MRNFITNYKITPKQLAEIESHLELASWILNSEDIPDWEDLMEACRNIADVREDLQMVREKSRGKNMIIERWELEEARENMNRCHVCIDAQAVAEDTNACPHCGRGLVYEGLSDENGYRAFALCPNCDYTEEF